jgi:hypothetical protein
VVTSDGVRTLASRVTGFALGIDWSPDGNWVVAGRLDTIVLADPNSDLILPLSCTSGLGYPAWKR